MPIVTYSFVVVFLHLNSIVTFIAKLKYTTPKAPFKAGPPVTEGLGKFDVPPGADAQFQAEPFTCLLPK